MLLMVVTLLFGSTVVAGEQPLGKADAANIERAATLKSREQAVQLKEEELKKKEQELKALQKEIDTRLAKLQSMQKEVAAGLAEFKAIQNKNFKNLIKVYSAMRASKLAPLLNDMDNTEVTKILRAMKADQVAKIIPKLNQQKAVDISQRLGMLNKK